MNNNKLLLAKSQLPIWLEYPRPFRRLVEQGIIHITPWHILEGQATLSRIPGLGQRYPARQLFPFAYKQDNDDIACWEEGMGEHVIIIHDFASPGYENVESFNDVWAWFRSAVDETIAWD